MSDAFQKAKAWWLRLPWYWKILGCVVLVGLALLWVLSLLGGVGSARKNLTDVDALHADHVDADLKKLQDETVSLKKDLIKKKKEIATKLNQAGVIDNKTMERRKIITEATTMEELDKLQKELDQ